MPEHGVVICHEAGRGSPAGARRRASHRVGEPDTRAARGTAAYTCSSAMHLTRRHFFFGSLALPAIGAKKPAPERPNVLLLIADNVPQWVLGSYGNKEIRTPNLDRLARMGTRFLDHYVAAPAPAPSRASILT